MNFISLKKIIRTSLFMISLILGGFFSQMLAQAPGELMKREDIPDKHKWNLTDLYTNDEAWEKDLKQVEKLTKDYLKFEGKLGVKDLKASTLEQFLKLDEQVSTKLEKVRLYASLLKDLNLKDAKYQQMYDKVMNLYNNMAEQTAWIRPELISIPESHLKELFKSDASLKVYEHYFDNILRFKPHTLPKEQERIMALASPVGEQFSTNYRMFTGADFEYPTIKDDKGNDIKMSPARYYSAMISTDRSYRKRAYEAIYVPYMASKNLLASNYLGWVKTKMFNAKARNYKGGLESALDQNNIPVEVYHNLVNAVNDNLQPLHRYTEIRRKALKVDSIRAYDAYVTLFEADEKRYTPDEAIAMVTEALKPLGEDYIKSLTYAFQNRWVDFYETDAKRSGAYSTGAAKGLHPFVLMNWGYTLNEVFTLAHEMGHNMHSWYTANTQPFPYADYPIFLAEVASTTNEQFLLNYLIKKATTNKEKLSLIETYLNNINSTFYRQTRFAEFEMKIQKAMEDGETFTADKLAKVFGDDFKKYFGPAMAVDPQEPYSWPRIPHFYYDFYVYQYATSFAASLAIADMIAKEGQPAIDRYLQFLKSGNSLYAIETLKKLGVDMTTKQPIIAVVNKANELMDQMENLMKK